MIVFKVSTVQIEAEKEREGCVYVCVCDSMDKWRERKNTIVDVDAPLSDD